MKTRASSETVKYNLARGVPSAHWSAARWRTGRRKTGRGTGCDGAARRRTFAPTLSRAFDNRIHFALNCGASSCPPVKLFRDESLDEDLAAAARAFVGSEVSVSGSTVTASKLFLWYGSDFGEDVLPAIAALGAGTPSGDAVAGLLEGGDVELAFADYDWSPNDASSV